MSSPTQHPQVPERWTSLVRAIAEGPKAWRSPEQLSERLALPIQETVDLIVEMEHAGWLAPWQRPDGPAVTLSAWAAARFGYRLIEIGRFGATRWAPDDTPDPPPPRARGVVRADSDALDAVADDAPRPDQELEWLNPPPPMSVVRRLGRDGRHLAARPRLLIGFGVTWPGPPRSGREDCPACGSRLLPPRAYCLYCDRSGADEPGAPPWRRSPRPKPDANRGGDDPTALDAQAERERRKQRRRERRAKRLEEERRHRDERNRKRKQK